MNELRVFDAAPELYAAAAELIRAAAAQALAERGRFLLVLAGGSTPRGVYERLATPPAGEIDWHRVHLFWGDERCVPPEHPHSNYRMAAESLLGQVPVPGPNVHRIAGEKPGYLAAAEYDRELREHFGVAEPAELGRDRAAFDLVLLGLGEDGHTASLFPGAPALDATGWAVAAQAPPAFAVADRVSLTFSAINASRDCLFLVTGAGKQETVQRVLQPAKGTDEPLLPVARVRPRGRCLWFLDRAAAGGLR